MRKPSHRAAVIVLSAILVSTAVLTTTSCQAGFLFDIWDELLTPGLDVSPSAAVLEPNQHLTLKALGGREPFSFIQTGGDGVLVDNADGTALYTAPASETDAWIRLSDSRGEEVLANIQVSAGTIELLRILPAGASLVHGGTQDFDASGGLGTYVFSVVSGAGSVDEATGLYTAPSSDTDAVVQVEDDSGQAALATVTVRAASQPLAIVPTSLSIEEGSTFQFSATGGEPPYTFDEPGGTITAAGLLTAPAVPATLTITVSDSKIPTPDTASATVTVVAAAGDPVTIVPRSVNVTMGASFQFEAEGGDGSFTYEMESGYGGSVTSAGLYTAPTSRQGTEKVRVRDGRGITDTATVKVKKK